MAIVNENVKIVKLLLDHGANVHERCLGSFFLPTDQKDKANVTIKRLIDRLKSTHDGQEQRRQRAQTGRADWDNAEFNQLDLQSNQFTTLSTDYDG